MCFTVPIAGRGWQGGSLSDSQYSLNSDVVFVDQSEVQQGMVAAVTQGHHTGCIISFKGSYRLCQWFLESFDLGSLCWLTFGGKSTGWWEISSCLE